MFALYTPILLTLATWLWSINWNSFTSISHEAMEIVWKNVPQQTIHFFERLPGEFIDSVADLNLTHTPHMIKNHLQEQIEKGEQVIAYYDWKELPKGTIQWVQDHPYQTALNAVSVVVFYAPNLVWSPILRHRGFGKPGPAYSSWASEYQSLNHPVPAGGIFATFQSANAKGSGYGIGTLNAAVRSGVGLVSGGCWLYYCFGENSTKAGKKGYQVQQQRR
ncbi:uncharacterized protein I206_107140 [Kwoniella pini CBS 10737]|uniref:Uncharacterized protein n=1 Tax=Kwoniella pini CBS 10737 TaxID=1296096 RepID=A0A1B9HZ22_9TREE|nr:uncharacterized protein I206_05316 [Kwoniella pini CBS 10737]OCF48537.1 hypothetical protein I206_05316 [Kwoniella pini CBS 10737]